MTFYIPVNKNYACICILCYKKSYLPDHFLAKVFWIFLAYNEGNVGNPNRFFMNHLTLCYIDVTPHETYHVYNLYCVSLILMYSGSIHGGVCFRMFHDG